MKRILLPAALVLALAGTAAFAQQEQAPAPVERTAPGPHHHGRDPHKAVQHLAKQLNLSADQTAKLEPIFATREQKISALNADTTLAPKDRHKQMHAIQQDTQQQLSTVLTPEQLDQMKSLRKGHHGKGEPQPLTPPNA